MATLKIERTGGLAGSGIANSRLRSAGEIDTDALSAEDKKTVDELFLSKHHPANPHIRDGFRYTISRTTSGGTESVEVHEENVPAIVRESVKDEIV